MFLPFWMAQRPLLRNRADEPIVIIPPSEDEDELEDVIDDIDEVSEQLALHQIISEERHTEILERVNECRTILEKSSQGIQTENPALAQMMQCLLTIQSELLEMKAKLSEVETAVKEQPPSLTIVETPQMESDLPNPESQTEEVSEDSIENPPEPAARKSRFL